MCSLQLNHMNRIAHMNQFGNYNIPKQKQFWFQGSKFRMKQGDFEVGKIPAMQYTVQDTDCYYKESTNF